MRVDWFHLSWGLIITVIGVLCFYATYARWRYWVDPPPTFYWSQSVIRDKFGKKGVIVYSYVLSILFTTFGAAMIWQSLR